MKAILREFRHEGEKKHIRKIKENTFPLLAMGRTGRLAAGLLVAASSAMAVMPQAASSNIMGIFCLLSKLKKSLCSCLFLDRKVRTCFVDV